MRVLRLLGDLINHNVKPWECIYSLFLKHTSRSIVIVFHTPQRRILPTTLFCELNVNHGISVCERQAG